MLSLHDAICMSLLFYKQIVNALTKDLYKSLFFSAAGCLYFDSKSTAHEKQKKSD